ncbi:hypothetical protein JCM10212_006819 [Sporobolomyces blumeae]
MSESTGPLPAADSLSTIQAGTVLLAVHGALFGYFTSEVSIYFIRFRQDRIGFRVLVCWVTAIEIAYIAVKVGGFVTMVQQVLAGRKIDLDTLWLNFAPVLLTVLMEGSVEGFFCWRLCAVSNKLWMKVIAVMLWCFSTISHIIWVSMLGVLDGDMGTSPRLRILLMMSFWGTAAENVWISSCLIYELAFSRDRQALKGSSSASISQLVSLAMRTSAILIVFELLVAILVSVGNQNPVALNIETSFATTIYTVLCATVVLHTLNYRTKIRSASGNFSSPVFFAPSKSMSGTTASRSGTNGTGAGANLSGPSSEGSPLQPVSSTGDTLEGELGEAKAASDATKEKDEEKYSKNMRWDEALAMAPPRAASEVDKRKGKKKRPGSRGTDKETGGARPTSGTGITVETVSWVTEERIEAKQIGNRAFEGNAMVIERGPRVPDDA